MFEFRLPDVGEGVSEGELLQWHVAPGDEVEEDEVIAEVETDKAVVDLPSPVAGTVETLHAEVGEMVPVGDVLITIDPADDADSNVDAAVEPSDGAAPADDAAATGDDAGTATSGEPAETDEEPAAASADAVESPTNGRVFAPPSVRRLAREFDVDLRTVPGSGPGGRITEGDVRAAAGAGGAGDDDVATAITEVAPEAEVGEAGEEETGDVEGAGDEELGGEGGGDGEPRSAIRRVDDGADAAAPGAAEATDRERTLAAPATRRLANELDVDIDAVPTEKTRDGEAFVEATDVSTYAKAQEAAQAADAAELTAAAGAGEAAERGEAVAGERETREPYRGIRRTIGDQMAESAFTIPHVTHHDRAVVSSLVEAREAMKARAEERGIRLTYVPFVLKAVLEGLREYPVLNTSLDEANDEVVYKHYYNLGVATATDAGLMVPVVEDVDAKGILQLASEVNELTEKARERSIAREEMQGGTFTITNFGAIGGEYATPLINHPETAILGLGAIQQRPVVVDGEVVARHTLPLSLSIDHRVIDGAEAAAFVNTVTEYLETPSLLLLE